MDDHNNNRPSAQGQIAPPCPITGKPAVRLIEDVPVRLLWLIWRYVGGTDVSKLFEGVKTVGLWQSPCGLAFFSPAIEGDDAYYKKFYGRFKIHEKLAGIAAERPEYVAAARHVPDGSTVLDVGAGCAGFRQHVPQASFTGLDPYADTREAGVLPETAEDHAARLPEHYDVVTAFQVIEHTTDPLQFVRTLTTMLKPGGTLILGVPLWPSPMIDCPNMPVNCPPHHLTWWNEGALRALAAQLGLDVTEITCPPPHHQQDWFYWMPRYTWINRSGRYFANKWSWHFNFLFSLPLSVLSAKLFGAPKAQKRDPIDILMVAKKPG